jgi:glycosyltransferase involved in cell wall biosynthesis
MKISIIIPSQNDTEYLSKLLVFLKANTSGDQIEEIIIINNFDKKKIVNL